MSLSRLSFNSLAAQCPDRGTGGAAVSPQDINLHHYMVTHIFVSLYWSGCCLEPLPFANTCWCSIELLDTQYTKDTFTAARYGCVYTGFSYNETVGGAKNIMINIYYVY